MSRLESRSESQLEFEGRDPEEALANAAKALGMPPESVSFVLLSMGSKGFLGLGKRKAKIRVNAEASGPAAEAGGQHAAPAVKSAPGERESRRAGKPRREPEEAAAETHDSRPPKGRSKPDEPREAKEPRERREPRQPKEPRKPGEAHKDPGRHDSDHRRHKRPHETAAQGRPAEELVLGETPPPVTRPGPGERLAEGPPDQVMLAARKILQDILERLEIENSCQVHRIGGRVILSADSADSALLIGRRGATLEALQLLVNKLVGRAFKNDRPENGDAEAAGENRVVVDVADYRARRHKYILETTLALAREARRANKAQTLANLTAPERRLVHMALKPIEGLTTQSRGNGSVRDLMILPTDGS